jgi:hypothetical protein
MIEFQTGLVRFFGRAAEGHRVLHLSLRCFPEAAMLQAVGYSGGGGPLALGAGVGAAAGTAEGVWAREAGREFGCW